MPANRATSGVIWAIVTLMEVPYAAPLLEQPAAARTMKPGVSGAASPSEKQGKPRPRIARNGPGFSEACTPEGSDAREA